MVDGPYRAAHRRIGATLMIAPGGATMPVTVLVTWLLQPPPSPTEYETCLIFSHWSVREPLQISVI